MPNDDQITRYFLGELSVQEAEHIDRECFTNSAFADSVFVVEDELIERYVRNELSRADRERFEQFYLTTNARRSRVEMTRRLNLTMNSSTSTPSPARLFESESFWQSLTLKRPLMRYALATLTLALVVIVVWVLVRNSSQEQVAQINPPINVASPENTPYSTPSPERPAPTVTPPGSGPTSQATIAFTLLPGTQREVNAGERVITLSPQTKTVELRFILQDQIQPPYQVELQTAEGETVFVRRGLTPVEANRRQVIVLRAPASIFAERDYIGRVVGPNNEALPSYSFRVRKAN